LPGLKEWLKRRPLNGKTIFIADRSSHLECARARALGATAVLHRPIDTRELLKALWGDFGALSADPANEAIRKSPAISGAVDSLRSIFASANLDGTLDPQTVEIAGDAIVGQLEAQGLAAWIEAVRTHHSATYQHCLLVTGLAAGFGQQIKLSRAD